MDHQRFDELVKDLHDGRIGRRRFLWRVAALGAGVTGVGAGLAAAQDPTPDPTPQLQAGETAEPIPQTHDDPNDPNPLPWYCTPGPPGPWFPVVPSIDALAGTDVHWYGLHAGDAGLLSATAFSVDGHEVSRCSISFVFEQISITYDTETDSAAPGIEVDLALETNAAGEARVVGTINGQPVDVGPDDGESVPLDPAQQALLAQWAPLTHEIGGLLDVFAATDDGSAESGTLKCAAAGYLAALNCGAFIYTPFPCVNTAIDLWNSHCT